MNWIKIKEDPFKEIWDHGIALAITRTNDGYKIVVIFPLIQIDLKNNTRKIVQFCSEGGEDITDPIIYWMAVPKLPQLERE